MKLTIQKLKQLIKEELEIFENEEEYKDFHTTAGRDLKKAEELEKVAMMLASGEEGTFMAEQILETLKYDVKFVTDLEENYALFYSDDLEVMNIIHGHLEDLKGVETAVEMTKPESLSRKEEYPCKAAYKYFSVIFFDD